MSFFALAPSMLLLFAPTAGERSAAPTASPEVMLDGGAEPRWIAAHRPQTHDLTVGGFVGITGLSRRLGLRNAGATPGNYVRASAEFGARISYLPSRFFAIEGEFAVLPAEYNSLLTLVYSARAQGVLQAAWWSVVPFVTLGGGVLGVRSSEETSAGNDADPALHVGGGVKINVSSRMTLRLDIRDVISPSDDSATRPAHNPTVLFGMAARFGIKPKPAPPPPVEDFDNDGVPDAEDWCSHEPGDDEHGCPFRDTDCDGVTDNVDRCPQAAGTQPDGCAPPDGDGDTVPDVSDACPSQVGVPPSGCPDPDPDRDGIPLGVDRCPAEPETPNGFDDEDGCPDVAPNPAAP